MPGPAAGHLSVRVEGLHPDDVPFLFERRPKRLGLAFAASAACDVLIALLVAVAGRSAAHSAAAPVEQVSVPLVWLAETGTGGGGGGGGNRMQEPAGPAEMPGRDALTVPVREPSTIEPAMEPEPESPTVAELIVPAQSLAAATTIHAGLLDPVRASESQGPGTGGGAGTGPDKGIGSGDGSGLGPGKISGTGDGFPQSGSGVSPPVEIYVPKPQYTPDAMRARVQGTVWVECVVQTNGTCTNTRVARSLDPLFGLDQEALKAARLFRFRPGMRRGEPVPVLVTIELTFSLH
jgi:periplasmic protein TonB